MSHPTKTKIAVIGAGLIGPRHAQTILTNPTAHLSAIVDPTPSGATLATTLQVPYHPSITSLVSSPDKPHAAIICTPNHTHVPIALELIAAKIHILIEKPIATDVPSGRHLIRAAETAGVKILVGHHRRFNSYIVATKQLLSSGRIGTPIAINGLWTTYKPPSYFDSPADWRRTSSSGGVILINLIHEIDTLQHLLGRISRVYAEPTISHRNHPAEEGAAITLRFASGVVGTFLISDNTPSPHNFESGTGENPDIPRAGADIYRIFGTEGTVSVPDLMVWGFREGVEKSWTSEMSREVVGLDGDGEVNVPFEEQLRHFVGVVKGEEEPMCTGEDGVAAVAVCEALKRSLEIRMPVEVDVHGDEEG